MSGGLRAHNRLSQKKAGSLNQCYDNRKEGTNRFTIKILLNNKPRAMIGKEGYPFNSKP